MVSVAESLGNTSLSSALGAGLETISGGQTVAFTKYVKRILPLDGYVFWLQGETMVVKGSLHYSTSLLMHEDETLGLNRVVFTSQQPVAQLNSTNPQEIWVATVGELQFAFSQQGSFYQNAGLFHYTGDTVNPAMASQLVRSMLDLPSTIPIVSNSLPAWLAIQTFTPAWLSVVNPQLVLYPSFLVPANTVPPYGTVHIEPSGTTALQSAPWLSLTSSHYQLTMDRVRVTLYGVNNNLALDFIDTVNDYTMLTDAFGLMNMPIVRDEKRTQTELQALAMKKTIDFEVSYLQTRINDLARQLILEAFVQYTVAPYP